MTTIQKELIKCYKILSDYQLLSIIKYPNYKNMEISSLRHVNLYKEYEYILLHSFYNFLLYDYSIIQIREYCTDKYSYYYLQCPFIFLNDQDLINYNEIEKLELLQEFLYENNLEKKDSPIHIRYDYSSSIIECTHPPSHFHIGKNNELRLGSDREIHPCSFVYFLIRQMYPKNWINNLERNKEFITRTIKDDQSTIQDDLWTENKKYELHLI